MRTGIDIVREQYGKFNHRKIRGLVNCFDPEVEFAPGPEAGPFRAVCHGREEVKDFFKRLSKVVVKFHAEPLRFLQIGDEVLVAVQMYGRFSRGVEAWITVIHCWTLCEGAIVGWRSFPDDGRSLEDIVLPDAGAAAKHSASAKARATSPG